MAVRFYMDAHVSFAITNGLRRRGVDVLTAQDDGTTTLDDSSLLERATALQRVLFTQDAGFVRLAMDRVENRASFTGIVFARQQRVSIGRCIGDLELIAKGYEPEDLASRVEYLPLKS